MLNGLVVIQDLGEWVYCLDTDHIFFYMVFCIDIYSLTLYNIAIQFNFIIKELEN
jgi:hypothetical protein